MKAGTMNTCHFCSFSFYIFSFPRSFHGEILSVPNPSLVLSDTNPSVKMGSSKNLEAGFAKLQGEDFEYYMQTYSIVIGRNSKKSTVDLDLSSLGGGLNISRHHARIFYDFQRRRFVLNVMGKNGCFIEGVLHLPGSPPVKLDSQDLVQIGDKKFYFLLPVRSILNGALQQQPNAAYPVRAPAVAPPPMVLGSKKDLAGEICIILDDDSEEDGNDVEVAAGARKKLRMAGAVEEAFVYGPVGTGKAPLSNQLENKAETSLRVYQEVDNKELLLLEEKDVISSVATVLLDLCCPGQWMAMAKLHAELVVQYGNVWHHSWVRKYLRSEDWPLAESQGRPWFGLLALLRKYPEHFVINTRAKGPVTAEFVSLVFLLL